MSKETKYTPGPWKVREEISTVELSHGHSFAHISVYKENYGNRYGDICIIDIDDGDNYLANARLIAAAPEMLEVLEDTAKWLENYYENRGIAAVNEDNRLVKIWNLIAKVEGESDE